MRLGRLLNRRIHHKPLDVDDPTCCYGSGDDGGYFGTYNVYFNPHFHQPMRIDAVEDKVNALKHLPPGSERVLSCARVATLIFPRSTLISSPFYDYRVVDKDQGGEHAFIDFYALPNFHWPARSVVVAIEDDTVSLVEFRVFDDRRYGRIDPGLYIGRFLVKKDDEIEWRNSVLDIIKCRFGDEQNHNIDY
jgi:hypothetical protein